MNIFANLKVRGKLLLGLPVICLCVLAVWLFGYVALRDITLSVNERLKLRYLRKNHAYL